MNINDYRVNVKPLERLLLRDSTSEERLLTVSRYSAASHCPLIACCHYAGEILGYWPELLMLIDTTMKFYQYDEIEGVKMYEQCD